MIIVKKKLVIIDLNYFKIVRVSNNNIVQICLDNNGGCIEIKQENMERTTKLYEDIKREIAGEFTVTELPLVTSPTAR